MKRAVLVFIAIAYSLSIAISLLVGLTGGYQSRFIGLGVSTMFFPTIAVLIVEFTMRERCHRSGGVDFR